MLIENQRLSRLKNMLIVDNAFRGWKIVQDFSDHPDLCDNFNKYVF